MASALDTIGKVVSPVYALFSATQDQPEEKPPAPAAVEAPAPTPPVRSPGARPTRRTSAPTFMGGAQTAGTGSSGGKTLLGM